MIERGRCALRVIGASCAIAAFGLEAATLELDLGVSHSDNIGRTPTDEESETTASAGIAVGVAVERPRLIADIIVDAEYRDYLDDAFESEVVGGLDGSLLYSFVIDRFEWAIEDNYGQVANNRAAAETPQNRQEFNYFTTGPNVRLPIGARTSVEASGRWSDANFEDSVNDSESTEGSLGLVRIFSERLSLSLNATYTEMSFDRDAGVGLGDWEIREGFVRIDATGLRTTLAGDFGYTEVERDSDSSGGALVRLSISREVGARSTLSLDVGSEFSDTGTALRLEQAVVGIEPGSQSVVAAADVFRNTYAFVGFDTEQLRMNFGIALRASRERHQTQTVFDRDILGGALTVGRRLSPRLTVDLEGVYSDEEFTVADFAFDEWSVDVGMAWQFSPAWSARLSAGHFSGSGEGIVRDYDENRANFNVRYSIGR